MSESGNEIRFLRIPGAAPDPEVFLEAVLSGWLSSLRARGDKKDYVQSGRSRVMDLCESSGKYPWEWQPQDATEWLDHLRGVKGRAHSTVRTYQGLIKSFCEYATSSSYDWAEQSAVLFGSVFTQVINEFNAVRHKQDNEAQPEKRAFTRRELQQLFDLMDLEYERALESNRSPLTALRDAAAFKTAYGWGLRKYEVSKLQIVDIGRNGRAPQFGDYGNLHVRFGKGSGGQAFKPRIVLTVFEWAAEMLDDWIHMGLPRYGEPLTDLFPTNRGNVVSGSALWSKMDGLLDELGFPPGLDFHSLRRSYGSHLLNDLKYDLKFIQLQLGHTHPAVTSRYTIASPDFQISELERVQAEQLAQTGSPEPRPRRKLKLPPPPPLKRRPPKERGT